MYSLPAVMSHLGRDTIRDTSRGRTFLSKSNVVPHVMEPLRYRASLKIADDVGGVGLVKG